MAILEVLCHVSWENSRSLGRKSRVIS